MGQSLRGVPGKARVSSPDSDAKSCEIRLSLSGHCVETAARNEFKRLMDGYFAGTGESGGIEERLALLREFIETSDFQALRASDERLSGAVECAVIVYRDGRGGAALRIAGQGRP